MELQAVINIIEDRAAEMNSESKVQVFPKQPKNWLQYNNSQHTISNSLNQTHTFPYNHKINFSPYYEPNIYFCTFSRYI